MRHIKFVIILCLITLINICACTPSYHNELPGRYVYTRLNANTVRVSFYEDHPAYWGDLESDLLYSCAFVTKSIGYDYFIIIGGDLSDDRWGNTIEDGQSEATTVIQMFKQPRPPRLWNAFDARQLMNNLRAPG